jgi:hypothetical protein
MTERPALIPLGAPDAETCEDGVCAVPAPQQITPDR